MTKMLEPGDVIDGFCGGAFGRDSYGKKTVVAVGRDWVVVREEDWNNKPNFAHLDNPHSLAEYRIE